MPALRTWGVKVNVSREESSADQATHQVVGLEAIKSCNDFASTGLECRQTSATGPSVSHLCQGSMVSHITAPVAAQP